jgi:alkanesulfonate monooxygenase SsuD/methylene tetrahydromethanopterin reductase-like flavin-dependent oxidoreductase (luciferase family)
MISPDPDTLAWRQQGAIRHLPRVPVPPWFTPQQVFADETERILLSETLGYDSVWVPEQHFYPYCLVGQAMPMAANIVGMTQRVRVGTAVVSRS